MSDPYFDNVTLLLHCNGADESTTLTDVIGHSFTANGNAQIDTAESKYGGASALFDGTGDYWNATYVAADFDWFSEDYTIEAWVYASSWSNWSYNVGSILSPRMIGNMDTATAANHWSFGPRNDSKLGFYYWNGSTRVNVASSGTLPTNEWVHIAMTHASGTIKLWINGTEDGSAAVSGTPGSDTLYPLLVGYGFGNGITGWVDDLRITKGVQRYTTTFTPPTEEFPDISGLGIVVGVGSVFSIGFSVELGIVEGGGSVFSVSTVIGIFSGGGQVLALPPHVGIISLPGMFSAERLLAFHDWTSQIPALATIRYVLDITGSPTLRIPISSWQATLKLDQQNYVQAVIPGVTAYVSELQTRSVAGEEFIVSRRVILLTGQVIEQEMARGPITSLRFDRGATNYSGTLSGYIAGFSLPAAPVAATDRVLDGVRSVSVTDGKKRVRCGIDWFLRPGQRADLDGDLFTVDYISYYANASDAYMDVGEAA